MNQRLLEELWIAKVEAERVLGTTDDDGTLLGPITGVIAIPEPARGCGLLLPWITQDQGGIMTAEAQRV